MKNEVQTLSMTNLLTAARRVLLGVIDLDPASTPEWNRIIKPSLALSLAKPWYGRVWLNPRYEPEPVIAQFTEKLVSEFEARRVTAAIALVPNATETSWFQRLAAASSALCLLNGLLKGEGQCVLYLGHQDRGIFAQAFAPFGLIVGKQMGRRDGDNLCR